MITKQNTIVNVISNNLNGDYSVHIKADKKVIFYSFIIDGVEQEDRKEILVNQSSFSFASRINNPLIWDLENPNLYKAELKLVFENSEENIPVRFAFRTLRADKKWVYLNDKVIFIRGYIRGAKAHEHNNNLAQSNLDFYRKNISTAKQFGFNLIRFHSVVPDEELFAAADEVGMLVHLEFRFPNDQYLNIDEMTKTSHDLVTNEFIQTTIDKNFNHPSMAFYCLGNELKNIPMERIIDLGAFVKKTDPSRLFIDTCAWGKLNRPNVDIDVQHMGYFFPFAKHEDMFNDPHSIHTLTEEEIAGKQTPYNVPLLAHEVCHYTALRDFKALKEKSIRNNMALPWWIDEELKIIQSKGFEEQMGSFYKASKHFQFICWKNSIEKIRRSPILSGFHFLQFADTDAYENSNGMVDYFDDPTYAKPEEIRAFNGNFVVTADFGNHILASGQMVNPKLMVSNFSLYKGNAELICSLDGAEQFKETISLENTGLTSVNGKEFVISSPSYSGEKTISVKVVQDGNEIYTNSWKLFVYPNDKSITYQSFIHQENGNSFITDDIEKALSLLEEGKRVCLIYRSDFTRHVAHKNMPLPKYAFKATWNRFKPVIWDRGTNYGGVNNVDVLAQYGFPSGKYYDFNYSVITEDCDKIILDDIKDNVSSLLTGIDKSTRDRFDANKNYFNEIEIMPDRCWRHFSYLFETKVGKGKLLVCGLNLTHMDEGEPSSIAMAKFIMNYVSIFNPNKEIDLESLKEYLSRSALKPVKERMMTQYWELDNEPVESKEYWIESRKYLEEE